MRKNNYLKLISVILMITLLTGCTASTTDDMSDLLSNIPELVSEANAAISNHIDEGGLFAPQDYTLEMFDKVFELVQEKDTQAIFDLFSDYVKKMLI